MKVFISILIVLTLLMAGLVCWDSMNCLKLYHSLISPKTYLLINCFRLPIFFVIIASIVRYYKIMKKLDNHIEKDIHTASCGLIVTGCLFNLLLTVVSQLPPKYWLGE